MIVDPRKLAAEGDSITVDPFIFWPERSSRIVPLGGPEQGDDPDYAFHTRYFGCGTGWTQFDVHFDNLSAERGTLILRIHELADVLGADARLVTLSQTQLLEVIRNGGRVTIGTETTDGFSYAVLGHIHGDCVARADALRIDVVRRTPDADDPALATRYSSDRVGAIGQLIGEDPPTLKAPVSQACTLAQFKEPVFADWARHVGVGRETGSIATWERVFIMRVLDRYDVARSGARGLGVGGIGDPLADALASAGCRLVLTSPAPSDAPLPVGATARTLDPHSLPDDIAGFDFCYVTRDAGPDADRQGTLRFVEDLLRGLKPGGLAVVMLAMDVLEDVEGDGTFAGLPRRDIDRLALVLVSRGHQVAQLRHIGGEAVLEDGRSAFGLILRKAG